VLPYGSMASTRRRSAFETVVGMSRPRFRLVVFLVRMWLLKALERLIFPVAVFLNLLAAPRWVLSLGMVSPWGRRNLDLVALLSHERPGGGEKRLEGRRPLVAAAARADGDAPGFGLAIADDEHEWHLHHLRVADLGADLLAPLVEARPQSRLHAGGADPLAVGV